MGLHYFYTGLQRLAKQFLRVILVFAIILLSSCTTKLSYNFLDWWIGWYVKDYVSLERQQKVKVKRSIKAIHQWHRASELPAYAYHVEEVQKILSADSISAAQLNEFALKSQARLNLSWIYIANQLAELLPLLTDEQVVELVDSLERKTSEYYDEFVGLDIEKRHADRVKRMRKFLQRMTGRLNRQQIERVELWSRKIDSNSALHYQQRVIWRERFAKILLMRNQPDNFRREIRVLIADSKVLWSSEYKNTVHADRMLTWQLLADLHATITGKQKRRLKQFLDKLRDDFNELSRS